MNKQYLKKVLVGCSTGVLLSALPAFATLVPIANSSFENPTTGSYTTGIGIPSWIVSGSTDVGVWDPSTYAPAILTAPDQHQVGYINGAGTLTSVSQNLGVGLQANTAYNLSIQVGGRADGYNPLTAYTISLYAGSTLLTSVIPVAPPTSSWATLTASYFAGLTVVPGSLSIVISTAATQLDFDNVKLDATPVPETSTMIAGALLLLPFGASTLRILRKRTV